MKIITKEFKEFSVRILLVYGKEWFVAKDIAEVLGYKRTRDAISQHCKKALSVDYFNGSGDLPPLDPQTKIIPESDVWRLIIKSRLPEAEKIEEWIMEEVLPSIRKTGNYSVHSSKSVQSKENIDLDEILVVSKKMLELASMFGLSREGRYISADSGVKRVTGNSPLELLGVSQRVSIEDMPII